MTNGSFPTCDGCGQAASPEHIARRLKRLEWSTRYRPVHIQTLFLGAASPAADAEFLYSPGDEFQREAAALLEVLGIAVTGKSADAVLVEFQRRGHFLTHMLECPLQQGINGGPQIADLLAQRASAVAARIRRSLKPKRAVLIGSPMETLAWKWIGGELGCPVLLNNGKPYDLEGAAGQHDIAQLRAALETPVAAP
jgi:hypothetical protein